MKKNKKFRLYTLENDYKCKVTPAELVFLFGVAEDETIENINRAIKSTGYYITD